MTLPISSISFDLAEAVKSLAERDEKLKFLIAETEAFQMDQDHLQSPYEALLEAIAYQSISGKAAATIFGRIKALSSTGRAPARKKCSSSANKPSAKPAFPAQKSWPMKDLAKKTIEGVVPAQPRGNKIKSGHDAFDCFFGGRSFMATTFAPERPALRKLGANILRGRGAARWSSEL